MHEAEWHSRVNETRTVMRQLGLTLNLKVKAFFLSYCLLSCPYLVGDNFLQESGPDTLVM